jgi:uncharacterized protein (DUF2147 family)
MKMSNSTQLWWKGAITQFGDMQKVYDDETLWTLESKDGSYASVILNGEMVKSFRCEGAWDKARKMAESLLFRREQLLQESWVTD